MELNKKKKKKFYPKLIYLTIGTIGVSGYHVNTMLIFLMLIFEL